LIPSPILKALSTIRTHGVDHLLMGGQACVLYGAAEFSRDIDLALLPSPGNLDRVQSALDDLEAEVIAVPPFSPEHLAEGLAVHFRCARPDAEPTHERIDFWLRELRTPEFLVEIARANPDGSERVAKDRPLLHRATREGLTSGALARALREEED
jgi:hypothetical protein